MSGSYLLDTNVVSETVRSMPDAAVMAWLDGLDSHQLYISVLTLGEIRKGALMVKDSRRRAKLLNWLDQVLRGWFADRVLAIDEAVAARWGELLAAAGRPLPAIDTLLAATAATAGLTLATRNVRDFEGLGVKIVNPWERTV